MDLLCCLLNRCYRRSDRGARREVKAQSTDGNWPWWLTAIGATVEVIVANWFSGTWVPLADVAYMRLSAFGPS